MPDRIQTPTNVISLAGYSRSGKTELICRLVEWFTARGFKVAVLKHSHGRQKIAESERAQAYHRAGARAVARAGPHLVHVTRYLPEEPDLALVLVEMAPQVDLVLVEGYKRSPLPKITLLGSGQKDLPADLPQVIALVSPEPVDSELPAFAPDEVEKLGNFIEEYLKKGSEGGNL